MGFGEMEIQAARLGIFIMFLLIASWQDYKTKHVDIRIFQIFGAAGLGICLFSCISVAADVLSSNRIQMLMPELWEEVVLSVLFGILPGLALLIFFKCRGGIGEGDGWFFLIGGVYLGLWDTIFVLSGAVLLCGLAGLGYYVSGHIRGSRISREYGKTQWPFLPFAAVPGLWITIVRLRDIARMMTILNRFRL